MTQLENAMRKPRRALTLIGWAEALIALALTLPGLKLTKELFWPQDTHSTHGELLPLVVPVLAAWLLSFAVAAMAAIRRWPRPWWWQLLPAASLFSVAWLMLA